MQRRRPHVQALELPQLRCCVRLARHLDTAHWADEVLHHTTKRGLCVLQTGLPRTVSGPFRRVSSMSVFTPAKKWHSCDNNPGIEGGELPVLAGTHQPSLKSFAVSGVARCSARYSTFSRVGRGARRHAIASSSVFFGMFPSGSQMFLPSILELQSVRLMPLAVPLVRPGGSCACRPSLDARAPRLHTVPNWELE